jgi:hypothetical protein
MQYRAVQGLRYKVMKSFHLEGLFTMRVQLLFSFFLSKKINELAFGDDLVFSHDTFFIMKFTGDDSVFSYFLAQRNY